jgi:hypothetical protein
MKTLLVICLLSAGCASKEIIPVSSPYEKYNPSTGGYIDYPLNDNRYVITFRGTPYTLAETVKGFAYRRAREVCNGDFVVEEEKDISVYSHSRDINSSFAFGNLNLHSEEGVYLEKPRIQITIRCKK